METFWKILSVLDDHAIGFELIPHEPAGRTDRASAIRGHDLGEAAKSMLIEVRPLGGQRGRSGFVLAVVPGHRKLDFKAIARLQGSKRAQLARPAEIERLARCAAGAVPPFSFHRELDVLVDSALAARERMVFNAGRLDRSIAISTQSYVDAFKFPCAVISQADDVERTVPAASE